MATVHLLHAGYIRDEGTRVGSSITLVRDGDFSIITDPGFVARRSLILDPLEAMGVDPESVTHVFFSHHHPDHTVNAALFPNAEIVDFWARYKDDLWLDNGGDGWQMTPNAQLWLTPGHTEEDASLEELCDKLKEEATRNMLATRDMVATKGRAYFLGERALGHIDPGCKTCEVAIGAVCDLVLQ